MKITIFGGSGFLGSHVADELSSRGHEVIIFDKAPYAALKDSQDMVIGDILDRKAVQDAVKGADVVYNFVALADIELACDRPLETAEINILGNINILHACKEAGVKKFIYSSTIYVYSNTGSFYRCSKQSSELFIENYQKEYGLDYVILRYGSLYGPRSSESNWIYRILKQALTEGRISREGNGEEIREYIHVQDAAKLSADVIDEEYKNQCYIVTGGEQMKIKDLLIMVKEILKGEVEIEYVPAKKNLHYEITPYVFNPQIATKLKSNEQVDMGQGILNILAELHPKNMC